NGMARARLDVGGPVHPRFASGILRAPAAIQGARERLVGAGSRGVIDRSSRAVFGPDGVVKTSPSRGPLDAESAKPPAGTPRRCPGFSRTGPRPGAIC